MSFNSPAKQERIERHLMRQRGAGVRIVAANFGFSFAPSAPTSSDATPVSDEPPTKRRKTILQSREIQVAAGNEEAYSKVDKRSKTLGKSRKRLPGDDEDPRTLKVQSADGEDSFIAGIGSKKQKTKVEKTTLATRDALVDGITVVERSSRARPTTRAAAVVDEKVADGYAEDTVSIDREEQDLAIAKQTKRKKGQRNVRTACPPDRMDQHENVSVAQTVESDCVAVATSEGKKGKRRKTRSRSVKDVEAGEKGVRGYCFREPSGPDLALETKPGRSTKTSRKRKSEHLDSKIDRVDQTETNTAQEDVEGREGDRMDTSAKTTVNIRTTQTRRAKATKPKKSSNVQETSVTQRQPLSETDTNVTMRSTSPEKLLPRCRDAANTKSKSRTRTTDAVKTECEPGEPSISRNLQARPNDLKNLKVPEAMDALSEPMTRIFTSAATAEVNTNHSIGTACGPNNGGNSVSAALMEDAVHRDRVANESRNPKSTRRLTRDKPRKPTEVREPGREDRWAEKRQATAASGSHQGSADGADVDWLFEPRKDQRQQSKPRKKKMGTATAMKPSKSAVDVPDIDLDDLLSNIAAFAEHKSTIQTSFANGKALKSGVMTRRR